MSDLGTAWATGGLSELGGLFKSKTSVEDMRTAEQKKRDAYLARLLGEPTPDIPTEQVAGMSDAEQLAQQILGTYGKSTPEGLDTLRGIANAPEDITQDPTISALLAAIGKRGDLSANRLSRSLMLRGGRGGAGRDILGRSVTDTQNEMLSTLAPYAESAKNRKMSAVQLLNSIGENATMNRLNALSTTGALPRTLKQLQNSASYTKLMQEVMFPYQQKVNVAGGIGNAENLVTQTPSMFSQIAPLVGQIGMMAAGA